MMLNMTYTLDWPGPLNMSYVIIDPNTNRVFDKDEPLPLEHQKLNTFENKYVNLSSVLDLFSEKVGDDAKWILQEMLERFGMKQLVRITSNNAGLNAIDYLPLSTFLPFAMIWPCCKAFQSLCKAIYTFLEDSQHALCQSCGWSQRGCACKKNIENVRPSNIFSGYGRTVIERGCQTTCDLLKLSEGCSIKDKVDESSVHQHPTARECSGALEADDTVTRKNREFEEMQVHPTLHSLELPTHRNETYSDEDSLVALRFETRGVGDPSEPDAPSRDATKSTFSTNNDVQPTEQSHSPNILPSQSFQGSHKKESPTKKRKRDHACDVEPDIKKTKRDECFSSGHEAQASDAISDKGKCIEPCNLVEEINETASYKSTTLPSTSLNIDFRRVGNKNGESSFWRLVEDEEEAEDDKMAAKLFPDHAVKTQELRGSEEKKFKKFRHTVFGDVVLRCVAYNCGQCFDAQQAADLHSKFHALDQLLQNGEGDDCRRAHSYHCTSCNFELPFSQWHNMLRHLEMSHGIKISSDQNCCGLCGLSFESKDKLDYHMDFHSNSHYRCIFCGISLFSWNQVQIHLCTCTKKVENGKDVKLDMGCPYCPGMFQKKNVRNLHLVSHTDDGLTCIFCVNKEPRTWKALKKHYDLKHAKPLKKINTSRSSLLLYSRKKRSETADPENAGASHGNRHRREIPSEMPSQSRDDEVPVAVEKAASKRGRKRKRNLWEALETVGHVREKKTVPTQKELEEKMRRLLRDACARTISYEDHKIIRSLQLDQVVDRSNCEADDFRAASSPSTASINDESNAMVAASAMETYPYLDHSYCKFDWLLCSKGTSEPLPSTTPKPPKKGLKSKPSPRDSSPSFGSHHTPHIENIFPLRTTRRQTALAGNNRLNPSYCYSPPDINSSIVPVNDVVYDVDLEHVKLEMTAYDYRFENELLKTLGGRTLIHDILASLSPTKNRKATPVKAVKHDIESIVFREDDLKYMGSSWSDANGRLDSPERHRNSSLSPGNHGKKDTFDTPAASTSTPKYQPKENGKKQQRAL